jgi:phosphoribosylanthranilate isomerase
VIASGGVSSLDDLRAISTLVPEGLEGAIIGTALYTGAFSLEDALSAVSEVAADSPTAQSTTGALSAEPAS